MSVSDASNSPHVPPSTTGAADAAAAAPSTTPTTARPDASTVATTSSLAAEIPPHVPPPSANPPPGDPGFKASSASPGKAAAVTKLGTRSLQASETERREKKAMDHWGKLQPRRTQQPLTAAGAAATTPLASSGRRTSDDSSSDSSSVGDTAVKDSIELAKASNEARTATAAAAASTPLPTVSLSSSTPTSVLARKYADKLTELKKLQTELVNLKEASDSDTDQVNKKEQQFKNEIIELSKISSNEVKQLMTEDKNLALNVLDQMNELEENLKNEIAQRLVDELPSQVTSTLCCAYIERQVDNCTDPNTLLRQTQFVGNKILSRYQTQKMSAHIGKQLDTLVNENVMHKKVKSLGTFSDRGIGLPPRLEEIKPEQAISAKKYVGKLLSGLQEAVGKKPPPPEMQAIYQTLNNKCLERWPNKPQIASTSVASLLMLTGITRAVREGTQTTGYGKVTYQSPDIQNAIIVSGAITSVVNQEKPNNPEMQKFVDSAFINEQQKPINAIVSSLIGK